MPADRPGLAGCGAVPFVRDERPILTPRDFARLERLAAVDLPSGHPHRTALAALLDRCAVIGAERLSDDVATLGSRVRFRCGERNEETRILVHPDDSLVLGLCLAVTTPLGLALLGRRPGTVVPLPLGHGGEEPVRLTAVAYQPESAERRLAALGAARTR